MGSCVYWAPDRGGMHYSLPPVNPEPSLPRTIQCLGWYAIRALWPFYNSAGDLAQPLLKGPGGLGAGITHANTHALARTTSIAKRAQRNTYATNTHTCHTYCTPASISWIGIYPFPLRTTWFTPQLEHFRPSSRQLTRMPYSSQVLDSLL